MTKRNFLLGKGERLIEPVTGVRGGGPKSHPYTFSEARERIAPMLSRVVRGIDQLPASACPNDRAVATVTLNPEYIAKSYFPDKLFELIGLEPVGSHPRRVTPEKRSKGREPEETITTELFLMGLARLFELGVPHCRTGMKRSQAPAIYRRLNKFRRQPHVTRSRGAFRRLERSSSRLFYIPVME